MQYQLRAIIKRSGMHDWAVYKRAGIPRWKFSGVINGHLPLTPDLRRKLEDVLQDHAMEYEVKRALDELEQHDPSKPMQEVL